MKSAIINSPWIQQYLSRLPRKKKFTDDELDGSHPYREAIHRKVDTSGEDMERNLGRAREFPKEYIRKLNPTDQKKSEINMNEPKLGLSCSPSCHSHDYSAGSFVYPYKLLSDHIGDSLISRHENSVSVCGRQCSTYKCYNRNVTPSQTKTVRNAFECHGKDDSFLIDNYFSCYWDSTEHCTLCLRESVEFDISSMKIEVDQSIIFGSSIFDRIPWTVCDDYLGVKISSIFFELAQKNKSLESELLKTPVEIQALVGALLTAFNRASIDSTEENIVINDAISCVFYAISLDKLSAEQSEIIIQIIDKYECEIYGLETTEWSEKLRPLLSSIISDSKRKS